MDTTISQLQQASQRVELFFLRMKTNVMETFRKWNNPPQTKTQPKMKEPETTTETEEQLQAPIQKMMSSIIPLSEVPTEESQEETLSAEMNLKDE